MDKRINLLSRRLSQASTILLTLRLQLHLDIADGPTLHGTSALPRVDHEGTRLIG